MIIRIAFFVLFCCNMAFAEGLASKESITYYNEAVKAQKANNLGLANASYQKALLVNPYDLNWQKFILNNQGIIFAQQGDIQTAEQYFNAALKIDPNYKTAQLNLGMIYELRRTKLESLEYWAKVFEFDKLKPKDYVVEEQKEEK